MGTKKCTTREECHTSSDQLVQWICLDRRSRQESSLYNFEALAEAPMLLGINRSMLEHERTSGSTNFSNFTLVIRAMEIFYADKWNSMSRSVTRHLYMHFCGVGVGISR
jgi:hypothetical protein